MRLNKMEQGNALAALPQIQKEAVPLLDYFPLSVLPGNLMPTVLSYLDALRGAQRWKDAVDVAIRIPLAIAPEATLTYVGDMALELHQSGEIAALDMLHAHIVQTLGMTDNQMALAMEIADKWRERKEYLRAYQLYRKIQVVDSSQQTLAVYGWLIVVSIWGMKSFRKFFSMCCPKWMSLPMATHFES